MTNRELNRDIKKMAANYKLANLRPFSTNEEMNVYYKIIDQIKAEYKRLYSASRDFEVLNKKSLLIMISLNNSLRVIPFHQFGLEIKY